MITAEQTLQRVITLDSKNPNLVALNKFKKAVPNRETDPFEEGDVFTVPANYQVTQNKLLNNAEFIYVTTESGKVVQFYPTSLYKRTMTYDETPEHNTLGVKRHSGNVIDWARNFTDLNTLVNKLIGVKIKIEATEKFLTKVYGTDEFRPSSFHTFTFVDEAPEV